MNRSWHNEQIAHAQELALAAVALGVPESDNPFPHGSMLWIQFRASHRTATARACESVDAAEPQPRGFWAWFFGEVQA